MRVAALVAALMLGGAAQAAAPLETVPAVDLDRYAGTWHEIARYPNFFQRNCAADVTAHYTRRADGTVGVENTCARADGTVDRATATARLAKPGDNTARLEVRFAPDFLAWLPLVWGNYWVIELAPDYSYAVVGEPSRDYLWILARATRMDDATFAAIAARLEARGYDPGKLIRTPATK